MAYGTVDENTVHQCTGKPLRADITRIASLLLNTPYEEAFTGELSSHWAICF
jgi:hypothetical protein